MKPQPIQRGGMDIERCRAASSAALGSGGTDIPVCPARKERALARRQVLRAALAIGAGAIGSGCTRLSPGPTTHPIAVAPFDQRKLIIVMFGGGTRYSESFGDPQHRWIPRLWNDLAPRGTLFTNVQVQGRIVHPNCTASALTGHVEWDDNDWTRPPAHPTVFEIHRKARRSPDTDAWAFMYASILARAGESLDPAYGGRFAANVVEPPTIPRDAAEEMERLLRAAAATGSSDAEADAARRCARLARSTSRISNAGLRSDVARRFVDEQYATWKRSDGTTSHDAFLADCAIAAMKRFAPQVLVVAFGEIDCAHYGSWSRYVEAIARTDDLTARLWRTACELPDYRDRTLMLILPDHGRQLERDGGPGFIHHSDFYTRADEDEGCRRIWMLALGPLVPPGRTVAAPIPNTAVAATGLEHLGLRASPGAAAPVIWPSWACGPRSTCPTEHHLCAHSGPASRQISSLTCSGDASAFTTR